DRAAGGRVVVRVLSKGNLVNAALLRRTETPGQAGFDPKWLIIGGCVVLAVYLGVVPLGFLLWQSFFTPQTAAKAAVLTLGNYRQAYGSPDTWILFWNSLRFAIGAALLAFCIGTLLAWMNERTNTPFKGLFFALSVIPLIIPGILFTVAWILLGSPKIGLVNLAVQRLFDTDAVFVNIYSLAGMVWVDGLHYSPVAFLLMTAAFRAIESFEVPALLGLPVGIQVFTSAIYQAVHRYPSQIGLASAYAVTLLLLTTIGVYFQSRLSSSGSKYATMTGKGFRPRPIDLGGWRYVTTAIFLVYALLIVVLPFAVLVWSSLQKFYSVPSIEALQRLTLDPYRTILSYPNLGRSVWNSLFLAVASATLIMLVTSVICWIVVKTKLPGRWLLDNIASLPMVFPGIVLGLAVMILYLYLPVGGFGTVWIMLIAYITRFMPYGLRYNTTSMLQIHKELEESAAMSGASWATTFRRVILPLLKPGLI